MISQLLEISMTKNQEGRGLHHDTTPAGRPIGKSRHEREQSRLAEVAHRIHSSADTGARRRNLHRQRPAT